MLSEQALVAQSQGELRRQQLVAEVVRPAEAEAEKVRTIAHAQADATRLQAEATATSGGVVLERMLVERMPEILAAAAGELRQANVTILNGAEGLGDLIAGLATQVNSILNVVRSSNGQGGNGAGRPAPVREPTAINIRPAYGRRPIPAACRPASATSWSTATPATGSYLQRDRYLQCHGTLQRHGAGAGQRAGSQMS